MVNLSCFFQKKNGRDSKEKNADSTRIFEEESGKSKGIEEDGERQVSKKENRFLLGQRGCIYWNGFFLFYHRVSFSFYKRWFYFSINFFYGQIRDTERAGKWYDKETAPKCNLPLMFLKIGADILIVREEIRDRGSDSGDPTTSLF